jgi:3-deoxy-D-manno-octulosonic-acid transferase
MTRLAYALLWWIATPFVWLRLAWRARRQPGYLAHWRERLGRYAAAEAAPRIWIHGVSVGETRAAAPLVEALAARYPGDRILVTHMTPTGRATGVELFGDRIERAWLPYDYGFAARRFFAHFRPSVGILLETEVWPRLIEEGARAKVPVVLANARLSERSARRYARWPSLARWAFGNLAGVAAQSRDDAQRFAALGSPQPFVMGNVKFDLEVPADTLEKGAALRARFGKERIAWVAGSTRDGEEALLLDAFAAIPDPSVLLVIVPRHPQRFEAVAQLAADRGLAFARRTDARDPGAGVRVVIGDSMGEMLAYYAAADVVIMGGSLLEYGSQNLIEACAVGKPVIVGPSTFNFEEAVASAAAAGAALRVRDAKGAIEAAAALTRDSPRRAAMGERAREFVASHRGAVGRLVEWLAPWIDR